MATDATFEIIATPSGGSTGANLIKAMTCLGLSSRFPVAVVADVDCNENRAWAQRHPFPSTPDEIVAYAESVGQFVWATFFFFRTLLYDVGLREQSFDTLFADADLVVRAVDDTYIYVYSPELGDTSRLAQLFPVEFHEKVKREIRHPF